MSPRALEELPRSWPGWRFICPTGPTGRVSASSEQAAQEALGPEYMEVLKLEKRWPFYEWIPELVTKE